MAITSPLVDPNNVLLLGPVDSDTGRTKESTQDTKKSTPQDKKKSTPSKKSDFKVDFQALYLK